MKSPLEGFCGRGLFKHHTLLSAQLIFLLFLALLLSLNEVGHPNMAVSHTLESPMQAAAEPRWHFANGLFGKVKNSTKKHLLQSCISNDSLSLKYISYITYWVIACGCLWKCCCSLIVSHVFLPVLCKLVFCVSNIHWFALTIKLASYSAHHSQFFQTPHVCQLWCHPDDCDHTWRHLVARWL